MAEGKKSFLAYCDWIDVFNALPDEKAGQLAKHLFSYVNDQDPKTDDLLINAVFAGIKNTLKRDLEAWEDSKGNKSDNGKLGNLKRWNQDLYEKVKDKRITIEEAEEIAKNRKVSPSDVSDRTVSQTVANIAVSDSVSVSVSDSVKENTLSIDNRFEKFWDYYDKKVDKKKCEKKFNALPEKDKEKIRDTLSEYIKANPDIQYRKNPLTYLNGACWNDELIEIPKKEKQEQLNPFEQPDSVYEPTPLSNTKQIYLEVDADMTGDLMCGNAKTTLEALKLQYKHNPKRLKCYVEYFGKVGKSPNLDANDVRAGIETLRELEANNGRPASTKNRTSTSQSKQG